MSKPINQKCLECAGIALDSYRDGKGQTTRGLIKSLHPECYQVKKCSRLRGYYRDLEAQRVKQIKNHRYLRYRKDACFLCKGKVELVVHHIVPQSRGGRQCKPSQSNPLMGAQYPTASAPCTCRNIHSASSASFAFGASGLLQRRQMLSEMALRPCASASV